MLEQMVFITSLNGLVVSLIKRRAHSSWTFHCKHYPATMNPLNSVWGLMNRNTQIKSGEAVSTFPHKEDWFHRLHDTQTVWKETGHTTRPFIPVVDRGERVYRDSHQNNILEMAEEAQQS